MSWSFLGILILALVITALGAALVLITHEGMVKIALRHFSCNQCSFRYRVVALGVGILIIVVLVLMLQMWIWAYILLQAGQFKSMEDAASFAADQFTTLGSLPPLPAPWQAVGPLIAIDGLTMFSLAISLMVSLMSTFNSREYTSLQRSCE